MLVTLSGMETEGRLLHSAKVELLIVVTPAGIIIAEAKLLQPLKAELPMFVTLPGILIEGRLLQSWKAELPMLVMLSDMRIEISSLHPENRELSIVVMASPSTTSFKADLQFFVKFSGETLEYHSSIAMLLQPSNAVLSTLVTLAGMIMAVRLAQFLKAELPMLVTLSDMRMETSSLHPENRELSIVVMASPSTTSFKADLQYFVRFSGETFEYHSNVAMLLQPSNAVLSTLIIFSGMVMAINPLQFFNELAERLVTCSPNVISFKAG